MSSRVYPSANLAAIVRFILDAIVSQGMTEARRAALASLLGRLEGRRHDLTIEDWCRAWLIVAPQEYACRKPSGPTIAKILPAASDERLACLAERFARQEPLFPGGDLPPLECTPDYETSANFAHGRH